METPRFTPVNITEEALKQIRALITAKNVPADYGLRIGVRMGGGCASGGMSYLLGFDQQKEGDDVYEVNNLTIFMEKRHAMYVMGKEIDYITEGEESGFVFNDGKN